MASRRKLSVVLSRGVGVKISVELGVIIIML